MAQLPPPPPPPIELPASLGNSHCAYPPCNALDFLPLPPCPHCSSSFCTEHATPSSHQCPSDPSLKLVNDGQLFQDKFNDLLPDPNRRALDRDATEQAARDKKEAALAVLKRTFGADAVEKRGVVPAAGPQPTKPKVVSPVIALMKLKQRAKPVDGKAKDLQMDERLYLTVKHVEGVDRVEQGFRELFLNKVSALRRRFNETFMLSQQIMTFFGSRRLP